MAAAGTPWFKLFSQARQHPKLVKLSTELGVPRYQAFGHVVWFWSWVVDFAPDGDLTRYTADVLESAAEWDGAPGKFLAALVSCRLLDQVAGRRCVHNWMEYAGSYRRALQQQQRRARLAELGLALTPDAVGSPTVDPPNTDGRAERRRDENRGAESKAAKPKGQDRRTSASEPTGGGSRLTTSEIEQELVDAELGVPSIEQLADVAACRPDASELAWAITRAVENAIAPNIAYVLSCLQNYRARHPLGEMPAEGSSARRR